MSERPWYSLMKEEPGAPDLPYDHPVEVKGQLGDDTVEVATMATGVWDWIGICGDPTHWRPLEGESFPNRAIIPDWTDIPNLVAYLAEGRLFVMKENFSFSGKWEEGHERVPECTLVVVSQIKRGGESFEIQDGKRTTRFNQCHCLGALDRYPGALSIYDAKYFVDYLKPLEQCDKRHIVQMHSDELEETRNAMEKLWDEALS